jgi:hypothetical protein
MPKPYRILLKDLGHINGSDIIYADSDAEAIAKAREQAIIYDVEIWQDSRFITRLTPKCD